MIIKAWVLTIISTILVKKASTLLDLDTVILRVLNPNYLSPDFDIGIHGPSNRKKLFIKMTVTEDFPEEVRFYVIVEKIIPPNATERLYESFSYFCKYDTNYPLIPAFLIEQTTNDTCIKKGEQHIYRNAGLYDFENRIPIYQDYYIRNTNIIFVNNVVILSYDIYINHVGRGKRMGKGKRSGKKKDTEKGGTSAVVDSSAKS